MQVSWQQVERILVDAARDQGFSIANDRGYMRLDVRGRWLDFEKLAREVAERIGK